MENNKDLAKSISEAIQIVNDHLESTNQTLLVIQNGLSENERINNDLIKQIEENKKRLDSQKLEISKNTVKIKAQEELVTTTYYEHYLDNGKHENLIGEFYHIKHIETDTYNELVIVRDKNWDFFLIRGKEVSGRYFPERGGIHYTIRKIDDTDWEIMASIVEKVRPKIHVEASTNKI